MLKKRSFIVLMISLSLFFIGCSMEPADTEAVDQSASIENMEGLLISDIVESDGSGELSSSRLAGVTSLGPTEFEIGGRKLVIRLFLSGSDLYLEATNYKWSWGAWRQYTTPVHLYDMQYRILLSNGQVATLNYSGEFYLGSFSYARGPIASLGGTGVAIQQCYTRISNQGIGANFAVINYNYTPPSFNAYITGPSSAALNTTQTWVASTVNTTGPVTYNWTVKSNLAGLIFNTGTSNSITGLLNIPGQWTITLVATNNGKTITRTHTVNVPYPY